MQSISDSALTDGGANHASPSPLIRSRNRISAASAARASFTNQHGFARRFDNFPHCGGVYPAEPYTPKYHEQQCDRELKRLKSQLNEIEDQLVKAECELNRAKAEIDSLMQELNIKKNRIRELEKNEKMYLRTQEEMETKLNSANKQVEQLQRHHEVQKERLVNYKDKEDKWEARKADFEEALQAKSNTVLQLERNLRDANDEIANRWNALKASESECSRLQREVEELKKQSQIQSEEYYTSIADWRNRLEKTVAENLAISAADMERNTTIAREMREKTEEVERLQSLLEEEKKQVQSVIEELTANFRNESLSITSKLATLEAELARRVEHQQRAENEHAETLQRLEEIRTQNGEKELLVEKYRQELAALSSEKNAMNSERLEVLSELDRKRECLKEAMLIMDGMREEIFACIADSEQNLSEKLKESGEEERFNKQLSAVISIIKAYGHQYEQLEMRLAVEGKRPHDHVPVEEVDMRETISDLRYRLFAADQKLAIYEKERQEWKDALQRFEEREALAKQKNLNMVNDVERWMKELDGIREEKNGMQQLISEYRTELESKSLELAKLEKTFEDTRKDNELHIQLISSLKEEHENEIAALKKKEMQHIEEKEKLVLCDRKKEEKINALQERITSLERAVQPCQKENVELRLQVSTLKKENEKYKSANVAHKKEAPKCEEPKLKSIPCEMDSRAHKADAKALLHKSRARAFEAPTAATKEPAIKADHSAAQEPTQLEGSLPSFTAQDRSLFAQRLLKRTSFYQMSRSMAELKPN
ncbi:hypothetical protein Q1695_007016 [Nippostrongylus brasiliensis]|nr:hypothetical protein Q1695_007016 [Nippostrongylus brasiliensis]